MHENGASGLGTLHDVVRPRLALVERFISAQLAGGPGTVQQAGAYVLEAGGKRVRPATLLAVARLLGYAGDRDVRYGGVIEMIHTATLVHDDIIDHASLRRGRATAHRRWGNQLTLLLGDWLYTRSLELALEVGDIDIMRVLSRATIEMTEGEILGLEIRGRSDVTREQYLDITRRKTAELFSCACSIPALFTPELRRYFEPLAAFGRNLGYCFQIVDDLLDITGTETRVGKPVFSDLQEGTLTLPFILFMPAAPAATRVAVEATLRDGQLAVPADELREQLRHAGVLDATRLIAAEYADAATAALDALPQNPVRDLLALAPALLVARES